MNTQCTDSQKLVTGVETMVKVACGYEKKWHLHLAPNLQILVLENISYLLN